MAQMASTSSMPGGEASSFLPEGHEDQLQLGFRMIQNAFNNKVSILEQDNQRLRMSYEEQKNLAATLQKKNSQLEVELVEGHQRSQQLAQENTELFKTVQNLRKQLQRLDSLKKQVMDSISEHQHTAAGEGDQQFALTDDYLKNQLPLTHGLTGSTTNIMPPPGSEPYRSPQYPGGMDSGASRGLPAAPAPAAYAAAPVIERAAPQMPVSAPTAGNVSPGVGGGLGGQAGGTAIDGKQFFRMARNNLSYEAFNEFLANIKRLNNSQQTREETLEEARRIFGSELQHLYKEFEQLLNRHAM